MPHQGHDKLSLMPEASASRPQPVSPPGSNALLRLLSQSSLALLRPHLEFVDLPFHKVLRLGATETSPFIHFPNDGVASLVIDSESGKSAEIGVVGKESMTSAPAALGIDRNPVREVMQIAGNGFRIRPDALRRAMGQSAEMRETVTKAATLLGLQIAQIAGCNRIHSAEQRLARWLLMAADRVRLNPLPLTQEFLAVLLGITRPSVSSAANVLRARGAIKLERQKVHILSRDILERIACECYQVIAGLKLANN